MLTWLSWRVLQETTDFFERLVQKKKKKKVLEGLIVDGAGAVVIVDAISNLVMM